MKLSKSIRKETVTNMLVDMFGDKVAKWEAKCQKEFSAQYLKETKAATDWYNQTPEEFKKHVGACSSFVVGTRTENNQYLGFQPTIAVFVGTKKSYSVKEDCISKPFGSCQDRSYAGGLQPYKVVRS